MWSRLAVSLVAVAALVIAGCELLTGVSSTSLFRPRSPETSWEKRMKEHHVISYRDPVLAVSDPIPTLVARRVEPKHPEKFTSRPGGYELVADRPIESDDPVSDEEQLAVSLRWLEEEFGIPPEVELHRGLTKSFSGVNPNEVMLYGTYQGLNVPVRANIYLRRDRVVMAVVGLYSLSEVSGSARPVVGDVAAREALETWLRDHENHSRRNASKRVWPVHYCSLEFGRPSTVPDSGEDLWIPVWSCDSQNAFRVDGYEGTPFRARHSDE